MLNVAVTAKGKVLRVASSAVVSAAKKANGATPKITDVRPPSGPLRPWASEPTARSAATTTPMGRPRAHPGRRRDLKRPSHLAAGLPGDQEG